MNFLDPLFRRTFKELCFEAQQHMEENGLDDPSVLESFLSDPDTSPAQLAHEPADVAVQAKRAARVQRAEFPNRGPDGFAKADRERKRKCEEQCLMAPSELQRAVEAPPQWHCRRLPSSLARSSRLSARESRRRGTTKVGRRGGPPHPHAQGNHSRKGTQDGGPASLSNENVQQSAGSNSTQLRPCVALFLALQEQSAPRRLRTSTGVFSHGHLLSLSARGRPVASRRRSAQLLFVAGLMVHTVRRLFALSTQAEALESTLAGTRRGQAWQTHSEYFAAVELLVTDTAQPTVLQCYAFWSCLEAWAALRFSDHRGLDPVDCGLNENPLRGKLTRTKTTGRDKKVQGCVLHVSKNCWLVEPTWPELGWNLWQKVAPWDRDYFLPVPTRALDHWERFECKYLTPRYSRRPFRQLWSSAKNRCCARTFPVNSGKSTVRAFLWVF